ACESTDVISRIFWQVWTREFWQDSKREFEEHRQPVWAFQVSREPSAEAARFAATSSVNPGVERGFAELTNDSHGRMLQTRSVSVDFNSATLTGPECSLPLITTSQRKPRRPS